nr:MAG TPA: hypothetical protein [Caudoviricetes sp.]
MCFTIGFPPAVEGIVFSIHSRATVFSLPPRPQ